MQFVESERMENIIIKYLNLNESITNEKARELTGILANGVKSLFRRLLNKAVIEKEGDKKNTVYRIIK